MSEAEKSIHAVVTAVTGTGEAAEVKAALKSDGAASAVDGKGRTALSLAAARGNVDAVKLLLDAGAVDSQVSGWSAAHHAAFHGHAEVLKALAAKDAGLLNVTDMSAASTAPAPVLLAASRGHVDCVEALLEAAPDSLGATDVTGRTALMFAASAGAADLIKLLVKRGATLNATCNDGKTALMWAVVSHKPASVGALCEAGAAIDVRAVIVSDVIVPGKDMSKGETAEDLANGKQGKNPTLRHIAVYLREWRELREREPTAKAPPMGPLPWVTHAEKWTAEEAEREAVKAANMAKVTEAGDGAAAAAADESDIFGADDAAPLAEATEKKVTIAEVPVGDGGAAQDLDALD